MAVSARRKLNFLLLKQEGIGWIGRCLEHNFVTQARTIQDLRYEINRAVLAHIMIAHEEGREPFVGLEPAPQKYWDMFAQSTVILKPHRIAPTNVSPPPQELRLYEEAVA